MARSGLFGSRTGRDHDGVDDRTEAREPVADETVSERHRTYNPDRSSMVDGDGVDDRSSMDDRDRSSMVDRDRSSMVDRDRSSMVDRDRDGVDDRDESPTARLDPVAPVPPAEPTAPADRGVARPVVHARASMAATIGVMVGLVGVAAALTGLLAQFGVVVGVIGLLFSFAGMSAGRKANVAGRGLGALGLLVSFVAIVFSVLALTHSTSWLDSNVDQVAKLRDWVNVQMPWMKNW